MSCFSLSFFLDTIYSIFLYWNSFCAFASRFSRVRASLPAFWSASSAFAFSFSTAPETVPRLISRSVWRDLTFSTLPSSFLATSGELLDGLAVEAVSLDSSYYFNNWLMMSASESFLAYAWVSAVSLEASAAFYFMLVSTFSIGVSLSFADKSFDLWLEGSDSGEA
jgi:hypothetical protein